MKGQAPYNHLRKHLKSNKPQPKKIKIQETTTANYNYKPISSMQQKHRSYQPSKQKKQRSISSMQRRTIIHNKGNR
jgi:hypothetical protein